MMMLGRIFMTHATKAVMKLLLSDNINLQSKAKSLYSQQVELKSLTAYLELSLFLGFGEMYR
jgi:Cft2 family RNA processing exonuclease